MTFYKNGKAFALPQVNDFAWVLMLLQQAAGFPFAKKVKPMERSCAGDV